MQKRFTLIVGIGFVVLGALALTGNLLAATVGFSIPLFQFWRLWPVVVVSIGLLLVAIPWLFRENRGLGILYIPGLPILVTGGILMFTSLFDAWGMWAYLWPLEPISLALGFAFAALWMRSLGLAIPAIIIGINGLVFQFCAVTGWWASWAALWTIEPLAVGLVLLLVGVRRNHKAALVTGLSICAAASMVFFCMSSLLLADWWVFRFIGPAFLIVAGFGVILISLWRSNRKAEPPMTPPPADTLIGEGAA